ncbi:MAG TPA: ferric iron reductase, partial [Polyangiales bacterium]|nr:ferric iron reductase [Polyangiales bacterium]
VRRLARVRQIELRHAALLWFDAYWLCAIEATVRIYDQHGIALEAHQQNVLLELDDEGMPVRSYYRDLQGVGLSACRREELVALVPELRDQAKVFEPDEIVRNGISYYLFCNQLHAVINRFGLDGLVDEATLLDVARRKLSAMRGGLRQLGTALVEMLLGTRSVPCKGNLLTRVADMDELLAENELAVYTQVDNPLFDAQLGLAAPRALRHAVGNVQETV